MKQQYRHSIYPLMFSGDKLVTAGRAARIHNHHVKKTKQEKAELNVWEGEGGKPASSSLPF